jgi:hypothetical protein
MNERTYSDEVLDDVIRWLNNPPGWHYPKREQITTFWGFYHWLEQQSRDANLGTAIVSQRFKTVSLDTVRHWWSLAERERARRERCEHREVKGQLTTHMRRFGLRRHHDVSGVSGEGWVAEGVQWTDGEATIHWLSEYPTTTSHPRGMESIERVHCHEGASEVIWYDDELKP